MNVLAWFAVVIAVFATVMACATMVVAVRRRRDTPILLALSSIVWSVLLCAVTMVARAPAVYRPILHATISGEDESLDSSASIVTADTMATDTMATDTVAIDINARGDSTTSAVRDAVTEAFREGVNSVSYTKIVPFREGQMDKAAFDSLPSARKTLFIMRLQEAARHGDVIAQRALREIEQ